MISMCGYCLDSCGPRDVMDVTVRHSHALARQGEGWSCVAVTPYEPNRPSLNRAETAPDPIRLLTDDLELRQSLERWKRTFDLAMVASDMGTWRYNLADNICEYDDNAQ